MNLLSDILKKLPNLNSLEIVGSRTRLGIQRAPEELRHTDWKKLYAIEDWAVVSLLQGIENASISLHELTFQHDERSDESKWQPDCGRITTGWDDEIVHLSRSSERFKSSFGAYEALDLTSELRKLSVITPWTHMNDELTTIKLESIQTLLRDGPHLQHLRLSLIDT